MCQYSVSFLLLVLVSCVAGRVCVKDAQSSCKCKTDDGYTLDLSPAAGTNFKATYGTGFLTNFEYNPCNGFVCGTSPSTTAVCVNGLQVFGTQDSVKFQFKDQKLQAVYSSQDMFTYTSTVDLICSQTDDPGTLNVNSYGAYDAGMQLSSKYACLTSSGGGGGGGLSIGSILLIVFFVILICYLIAGVAFQAFYRKESGANMVPNRSFWMSLPGLIKDGFVFILVKVGVKKGDHYEQM